MATLLGWIQATSAFIAIWVAVRVVLYQSRLRAVERLEAAYGVACAVAGVLDDAAAVAREAVWMRDSLASQFPMTRFAFAGRALASTPLHELQPAMIQAYVIDLQQLLAEAWADFEAMRRMACEAEPPGWFQSGMAAFAADALIIADELRQIAGAERRDLKKVWI